MKIIIVGHRKRIHMVNQLLSAFGPDACAVVDQDGKGAQWGHREALKLARELDERVVIMEDDAMPVEGFVERASEWISRFPDDMISFYLGTGRPPQWQSWVDNAIATAGARDNIVMPLLIHGVCYTLPTAKVPDVIRRMRPGPADYSVGEAWGKPVVYPIRSLVDHRDGPSVEVHPDGEARSEVRRARQLAGPLMEI